MMQAIKASGYDYLNTKEPKVHPNTVKMQDKRCQILAYINCNIGTAKTVSEALDMVKSTAHNNLTWLAAHGKILTRKISVRGKTGNYSVREYYSLNK